jgi:hypothetical protein
MPNGAAGVQDPGYKFDKSVALARFAALGRGVAASGEKCAVKSGQTIAICRGRAESKFGASTPTAEALLANQTRTQTSDRNSRELTVRRSGHKR